MKPLDLIIRPRGLTMTICNGDFMGLLDQMILKECPVFTIALFFKVVFWYEP